MRDDAVQECEGKTAEESKHCLDDTGLRLLDMIWTTLDDEPLSMTGVTLIRSFPQQPSLLRPPANKGLKMPCGSRPEFRAQMKGFSS